jgi:Transposase zinc-ribbon domain
MAALPRSLPAFEARFPDEAACARWLFEQRWPEGFRCPNCGGDEAWELGRTRLTVQCAGCERQVSVTAGTLLHRSHLSLKTWFLAAWLMATHKNGISARQLWRQLGLGSYKSAWLLCTKLRRAVVDPKREPLAGLVEVDASSIPFAPRTSRSPRGGVARTKASSSSAGRSRSRARRRAGPGSR